MDIRIKNENASFHCRTRAIIEKDGRYLILRPVGVGCEYYYMVGGHIEIGETSEQAVLREIKEEVGIDVAIERLVCIHEHFYNKGEERFHEIVFYYTAKPNGDVSFETEIRNEEINGETHECELRWATVEKIAAIDLKPALLKDIIVNNKLNGPLHIVN
ncbi:MAG: NUDIX domain-containing protein [Christensenellaceae bacterium]|jgi:ADP-ribose pyrophosphatase YjhB (NUDIX family)|nr:NUDIX domain-containing protein [Christensenellaceae bacterium]